MRVAFQGVRGAFSEAAALKFFNGRCTTLPLDRFEDVFRSVGRQQADRGIIPIENSLAGSIHQNYDLLLAHKLHIVGEIHFRIEHMLMCHSSASPRQLTHVRSHPLALAQCSAYLSRNRRLAPVSYFDTAGAAKSLVDENACHVAAIGGELAASLYGLKILKRNIENNAHNFTRFLLLARTPWAPRRGVKAKSSIVFAPSSNHTGALFQSLGVFYVRNIDMLKIESRPDPHAPFEYLFYLDIAGTPAETRVAEAFRHLREKTKLFRLLGSYPMGKGEFYGAA